MASQSASYAHTRQHHPKHVRDLKAVSKTQRTAEIASLNFGGSVHLFMSPLSIFLKLSIRKN